MKKFLYILMACGVLGLVACSKSDLQTSPAGSLSGEEIFSSPDKAQTAVNGIYRFMYTNGWSSNWAHENPGISGVTMVHSLMGEDHYQYAQGSGWFYFDYAFGVDSDWTNTAGRQYSMWNLFYTLISQANYVTDHEATLATSAMGKNVLAQAYAIRAFSYYNLYEGYCQGDYTTNKSKPGVPIYTVGTDKNTQGVGRGTIEKLFVQINADFKKATDYFTEANASQAHASHIDRYTAYGLWARAALAQQDYSAAGNYAKLALMKPGLKRVATVSELGGFNNRAVPSVMWAYEVTADQAATYGGFFSHMDPKGNYGKSAPQCMDTWLYNQMKPTDARRAWASATNVSGTTIYWQTKYRFQNTATGVGDLYNMRAEEMLLIQAECECRAGQYTTARALMKELLDLRDPTRDISTLTDAATYSPDTHATPTTLMEEILLQRRIELWCEGGGRTPDLRRLNLGFSRVAPHPERVSATPNDTKLIWKLPLKEFDSNPALDLGKDQN